MQVKGRVQEGQVSLRRSLYNGYCPDASDNRERRGSLKCALIAESLTALLISAVVVAAPAERISKVSNLFLVFI